MYVRGRHVPYRQSANVRAIVGDMRVEWVLVPSRSRYMKFASLREVSPGGIRRELLPYLLDPEIVGMVPGGFSLSGFEQLEGIEYRQAWRVALPPADA